MEFYSFSRRRAVLPVPVGTGVISKFSEVMKEDGTKGLVVTGKTNVYEKIQACVPACNVNNIVRRFEMGDVSVIQRSEGVFGDFSNVPNNIIDLHNTIKKFEDNFNQLPAEVRAEFGNSPFVFMNNYESFVKDFDKKSKKPVKHEEKVKEKDDE